MPFKTLSNRQLSFLYKILLRAEFTTQQLIARIFRSRHDSFCVFKIVIFIRVPVVFYEKISRPSVPEKPD